LNAEAKLRRLLDREEISNLRIAFSTALGAKDRGEFTIMGQKRTGREEIAAGPARDLERHGPLKRFSTNHPIEVDGNGARACHYVIAGHGPDADDVGGRYVRTADGLLGF
jgi:hypothetical protein